MPRPGASLIEKQASKRAPQVQRGAISCRAWARLALDANASQGAPKADARRWPCFIFHFEEPKSSPQFKWVGLLRCCSKALVLGTVFPEEEQAIIKAQLAVGLCLGNNLSRHGTASGKTKQPAKHVTRRVGQFVHSTDHALKPRHIVLRDTLRKLECIYLRLYRLTLCLSALITHAGFPCSETLAVCNEVQDVR